MKARSVIVAALLLAAGCGREAQTARDELERVRVGAGFELVTKGERAGFNGFEYELYSGPRAPRASDVTPPSDAYESRSLVADLHSGWKLVAAWNGPSEDRSRECLITAERPDDEGLPADLTSEERSELTGDEGVLRVTTSCSLPQHHF